jgi:hypothetical protein
MVMTKATARCEEEVNAERKGAARRSASEYARRPPLVPVGSRSFPSAAPGEHTACSDNVTPLAALEVFHSTPRFTGAMMHYIRLGGVLWFAAAAACAKPTADDPASRDAAAPPLQQQPALPASDTATDPTLRRLEHEAIALAKADGCSSADQCRSAPVGNRPCGGPRYYVPYCPLTTDSTALFAKLAELARAEADYNRKNGLVSTCEMRMPTELAVVAGSCRFR